MVVVKAVTGPVSVELVTGVLSGIEIDLWKEDVGKRKRNRGSTPFLSTVSVVVSSLHLTDDSVFIVVRNILHVFWFSEYWTISFKGLILIFKSVVLLNPFRVRCTLFC